MLSVLAPTAAAQGIVQYAVRGDEIREPLTAQPGDAARGRQIALDRSSGACVLCHAVPESAAPFMGNVALPLTGVGRRFTEGQLRLRVADSTRVRPDIVMPSYFRVDGFNAVAESYRGKPVLTAQQVEDVVAYLRTLK